MSNIAINILFNLLPMLLALLAFHVCFLNFLKEEYYDKRGIYFIGLCTSLIFLFMKVFWIVVVDHTAMGVDDIIKNAIWALYHSLVMYAFIFMSKLGR